MKFTFDSIRGFVTENDGSAGTVVDFRGATDQLEFRVVSTARNIVLSNVTLSAFVVAANSAVNDNVLNVEGDIVLLTAQTTSAENGLYVVGLVTGGVAPLTRSSLLPAGTVAVQSKIHVHIAEGNCAYGHFTNFVAGTIGTDNLQFRQVDGIRQTVLYVKARQVIHGNVPDLNAMVVAADANLNDNLACVANSGVLLVGQTNPVENGLYRGGSITNGTQPMTRLPIMPTGITLGQGATGGQNRYEARIALGDKYGLTTWFDTATAGAIVGTNNLTFVPNQVTQAVTLVSGSATITNVPVLSATKTQVTIMRTAIGGAVSNTFMYALSGSMITGSLGTASVPIIAAVASGTINTADGSTLQVSIINR